MSRRTRSNLLCRLLCLFCSTPGGASGNPSPSANTSDYDSRWADASEFKRIVITRSMLSDHLPNTVEKSLKYFSCTDRLVA